MSDEERMVMAQQLRKMSRYAYLKMRTEQQMDIWKRRLEDEKRMFAGIELTEEERKINDINQKIYELASKRLQKEPELDSYRMPDPYEDEKGKIDYDKKYKVLYDRYREPKKEVNENEAWEKYQKNRSLPKYGALNKKKEADKYSFVMENQIDFVQQEVLEGYLAQRENSKICYLIKMTK